MAGASVAFNGADAVTVASATELPSGAHLSSLEAWVDMAGGGVANEGLMGYGNYRAGLQADVLRTNGWARLDTYWWGDGLWANGSASLIGGRHLATATYDGHARRLYLDGPLRRRRPERVAEQPGPAPDLTRPYRYVVRWRNAIHVASGTRCHVDRMRACSIMMYGSSIQLRTCRRQPHLP